MRPADVSKAGSTVVEPSTWRMARIDRRTASRNAALAFSIRCQRSATWIACGAPFDAARPYLPPRSRETTAISLWVASHACTVPGSRSGSRSMMRRRSRSHTTVP
jgi:hypothetical protein